MRVVFADPNPVPGFAPSAIQILQSVDGLARAGAHVVLLTPQPPAGVAVESVLGRALHARVRTAYVADVRKRWFWPTRSSRPFYWLAVREVRRLARAGAADALLVRNLKLAEVLLRAPGMPPLFFETHELFAQSFREAAGRHSLTRARKARQIAAREAFVYRGARGLASLTRALADDIRTAYGTVAPIEVVPDGVDLELAAAAALARPPNPRPVVLYLGSLHRWKGVEVALKALQALPGCDLHVAGGTDARIAELRTLASALGLGDRARFVGRIEPRRRFECIARSDICLLPLGRDSIAARYTSPLKLFEYMVMGKPIVASDLPSLREVLTDRETALLVPPEDPATLAGAIHRLCNDPDLAVAMGRRAQARARAQFGWAQRSERLLAMMARELAVPAAVAAL
jgi:glycosyltransferase involved in cell wall biosynthesis